MQVQVQVQVQAQAQVHLFGSTRAVVAWSSALAHSMTREPWGSASAIPPIDGSENASRHSDCLTWCR